MEHWPLMTLKSRQSLNLVTHCHLKLQLSRQPQELPRLLPPPSCPSTDVIFRMTFVVGSFYRHPQIFHFHGTEPHLTCLKLLESKDPKMITLITLTVSQFCFPPNHFFSNDFMFDFQITSYLPVLPLDMKMGKKQLWSALFLAMTNSVSSSTLT